VPGHIVVSFGLTVNEGIALTFTTKEVSFVQLLPLSVAVTVYVVVVSGETVILLLVEPVLHKNDVFPKLLTTFNVDEFPEQIKLFPLITGIGLTVTVVLKVSVQPYILDPITVYI
jgi:hypothetical protein